MYQYSFFFFFFLIYGIFVGPSQILTCFWPNFRANGPHTMDDASIHNVLWHRDKFGFDFSSKPFVILSIHTMW